MNYQNKLKQDQLGAIEYVLARYLSEEKATQALSEIIKLYWPDDIDDDSGNSEPLFETEPVREPIADTNYYPSEF